MNYESFVFDFLRFCVKWLITFLSKGRRLCLSLSLYFITLFLFWPNRKTFYIFLTIWKKKQFSVLLLVFWKIIKITLKICFETTQIYIYVFMFFYVCPYFLLYFHLMFYFVWKKNWCQILKIINHLFHSDNNTNKEIIKKNKKVNECVEMWVLVGKSKSFWLCFLWIFQCLKQIKFVKVSKFS